MSYTSKDIKNIVAEILENKKDKGGVKSLYFVGCGGSLGALYPAKTFMEKECSNIKSALINSNEFVHSTPKDFGENSIICLSCHKGNTPETIAAAKLVFFISFSLSSVGVGGSTYSDVRYFMPIAAVVA